MNKMTLTCHNGNSASEVRYLASGELGLWRGPLIEGSADEGEGLAHLGEDRKQKGKNKELRERAKGGQR